MLKFNFKFAVFLCRLPPSSSFKFVTRSKLVAVYSSRSSSSSSSCSNNNKQQQQQQQQQRKTKNKTKNIRQETKLNVHNLQERESNSCRQLHLP
mmetsp:Transcript_9522/g.17380  ORF Transcript_9522/g.17380 Transcript_9522/m.17380 type:complete len:94 (-) Transcript_9522:128-409(-)